MIYGQKLNIIQLFDQLQAHRTSDLMISEWIEWYIIKPQRHYPQNVCPQWINILGKRQLFPNQYGARQRGHFLQSMSVDWKAQISEFIFNYDQLGDCSKKQSFSLIMGFIVDELQFKSIIIFINLKSANLLLFLILNQCTKLRLIIIEKFAHYRSQLVIIINKKIENKMQQKQRPFSSKPISTIPIFIDQCQNQVDQDHKLTSYSRVISKPKLSHIVPQLPQFGVKSNSTALLYSKFIVKGLKEDKVSYVKSALKKKDEITEACTIYQYKPSKSIAGKTNQGIETICLEEEKLNQEQKAKQKHINSLLRARSAKVFRKTNNKQIVNNQVSKQKVLVKNKTEANLQNCQSEHRKRPTTAKISKHNDNRLSHAYFFEQSNNLQKNERQSIAGTGYKQLPVNSIIKGTPIKSLYSATEINELVNSKIKDKPVVISSSKGIDHIERNIQNITSYSRKTGSIYLTNANIQNILQRRKQNKCNNQKKQQGLIKVVDYEQIPQPQQIFGKTDKQLHEKKLRSIECFLQKQAPQQFETVRKQIIRKEKKNNISNQSYQELLSKDLDNHCEHSQQINDKSAKACFQDYIRTCQVLQYNISTKMKTEQSNSNNNHTLNISDCQKIIQTYQRLTQETDIKQKTEMINKIKGITQNLKFFSHKSKQQVDDFFTLPFEILIAEQECVLIEYNTLVNYIYIILNGSALVQSSLSNQNADLSTIFGEQRQSSSISLYDGEFFGEPSQPYEKFYKCKVTTLEQSLLLRINYEDYLGKFFEGSQIEQKLQTLRLAFKMEIMTGTLKQEHLQKISVSLEKKIFSSKSLVFRQGDSFENLILVKRGTLACISEFILDQDIKKPLDMKQIDKNIALSKEKQCKSKQKYKEPNRYIELGDSFFVSQTPVLKNIRRENLINYEILKQEKNKRYYYFIKQHRQFIRGDIINWEPICSTQTFPQRKNNFFQPGDQKICHSSKYETKFSLMSTSGQTEVYFLSKTAFQYLPNNIRKLLLAKGKRQINCEVKVQSAKQIIEWKDFKQKLCDEIVQNKKQRVKARC